MLKFSANLSFLYQDLPSSTASPRRRPMAFPRSSISGPMPSRRRRSPRRSRPTTSTQALFNVPSGDWAGGERGIGCLPDRVDEFRAGVATALDYAEALGCPKVNCLAGHRAKPAPTSAARGRRSSTTCKYAAPRFADAGIKLLIEPINTRDIPGFFLTTTQAGRAHPRAGRARQSLHPVRRLPHAGDAG